VPSDNVNDSKVVEDVNILPEITSIVKNALVDFGTSIIDEIHISSDSTSDDSNDMDEITESDIPAKSSKPFEFPCAGYGFVVVPTELSLSELFESLAMIQHVVFSAFSFTGCLEFIPESSLPLAGPDMCILGTPYIFFFHC